METNENEVLTPVRKKRNFKDALVNVSKFTSACRWTFMVVAVAEMLFACLLWLTILISTDVDAVSKIALAMVYATHYFIPIATFIQIVLMIVLGVDAMETKTEIKVRIIFVFFSIAPVLMTWTLNFDFWKRIFTGN
jgi:hypothetical protein